MTTNLDPVFASDSMLFKVSVYDEDGVTLATPVSCTCIVYNADTNAIVQASAAGTVGLGYAQYNWAGTSTAGNYEAVLTVTISATVIKTEHFRVTVKAKPPAFTILLTTDIGKVRFEIGDDVEGSGVLPDGSIFSDAQVQHALDVSGGVYAAVAHLCRSLAARWTIVPDKVITDSGALNIDRTQQVKHWRDMASEYTRKAAGGGGLVSLALDRRDAWSVADEVGGDELMREEDTTYSD